MRPRLPRYPVVIDIPESANVIVLGIGMRDTGAVWIDDAKLAVVGKTIRLTAPLFAGRIINQPVDATKLPTELLDPDFEDTVPRPPGKTPDDTRSGTPPR